MKGKEGTGDPGGADAKSGSYSSGSGLCPSGENGFFADVGLDDLCQSLSGPNYPDRRSPHMLDQGPDSISFPAFADATPALNDKVSYP